MRASRRRHHEFSRSGPEGSHARANLNARTLPACKQAAPLISFYRCFIDNDVVPGTPVATQGRAQSIGPTRQAKQPQYDPKAPRRRCKIPRCVRSLLRFQIIRSLENRFLCQSHHNSLIIRSWEPCPGITSHSSSNSSNHRTDRRRCPFCPRRRGLRSMTSSSSSSSIRPSTIPATSATSERPQGAPASASAGAVGGSPPSPC